MEVFCHSSHPSDLIRLKSHQTVLFIEIQA